MCTTPDGKRFIEPTEKGSPRKTIETAQGQLTLSYKDGTAILSGLLQRPTPCVNYTVEIGGVESMMIDINIYDSNKGAMCIQTLGQPQEIKEIIDGVNEGTIYTVKFEDKVIFEGKLDR